jgi:hypothetical protein
LSAATSPKKDSVPVAVAERTHGGSEEESEQACTESEEELHLLSRLTTGVIAVRMLEAEG